MEEFDPDLYDFSSWVGGSDSDYEVYYLVVTPVATAESTGFIVITREEWTHQFGLVLSALFT